MSHIDPEIIAIEALEGSTLDAAASAHLQQCAVCQDDIRALRRAADAGRAGTPDGLEAPGPHVWDAIAAEVAADRPPIAGAGVRHRAPRHRRRVAGLVGALVAAAAAIAIVVAVALPRPQGIATATLDAFPDHPGARGTAELEREPDGTERVRVELDADLPGDGFREVWLLTADGSALVSLGVLEGTTGSFAVPGDVDTSTYSVVDVSQEPTGGGAEHSGDSIVRGRLTSS